MNAGPACPTCAARTALAASLLIAMAHAGAVERSAPDYPAIPLEWPLPHARAEQTTPLWARIEAMRLPPSPVVPGRTPATLLVSSCEDDDSAGSLRTRIGEALSGDTIDLSTLTCSRISLNQGALKIELDSLTLRGPGADALVLDGLDQDRILFHPGSGTLTLEDLTVANGRFEAVGTNIGFGGCVATAASLTLHNAVIRDCTAVGVGAYGGGVLSGFLTMVDSTISGNTAFGDHPTNGTAAYGGGAFSYGVDILDSTISGNSAIGTDNAPLSHWEIGGGLFIARNGGTIERSTFSDNFAIRFAGGLTQEGDLILRNSTVSGNSTEQDDGGGIRVRQDTAVLIENSTIAGNHAGSTGGGISFILNALPSTLQSTIVSGNTAAFGGADLDSQSPLSISGGHNLVVSRGDTLDLPADTLDTDPGLLPLANNGGPTRTHALGTGSIAIDSGANPQGLATDQRGNGFARVFNGAADIGAFETQGALSPPIAVPGIGPWAATLLASLLALLGGWRQRLGGARQGRAP
ncbi:right-handed parallel beta-helix repeat-containing protein [Dokdonella immobilis]|uniref:Right handed beta helix region n=1 Tax=Dokdonella immobilis TaxID=578942 RepID=A0A1I4YAP7_9GAMM|nr:right-handed parallel beta-helix repeat-containing protein [Dokdonella immobilis]SFN34863.1 Right handed beta helix region [Dokdonella immobilis]